MSNFAELMQARAAVDNAPLPEEAKQEESKSPFVLLSADDLKKQGTMQWNVKGLIPRQGVGQVYGGSMAGKSFLVTDLAAHLAAGKDWYGYRVNQCPVVVVCLEGQAGYRKRVQAYEEWHRLTIPHAMQFIMQAFAINDKGQVAELATIIPKGACVIIDTQNASAPFVDENSSKDMGAIVEGAKTLARLVDGFVLLVAHTGKDPSKGARGSSVQLPAWDFCLEVRKSGDRRSWRVMKSKDGEDGQEHSFRLAIIDLGKDEDGDPITSCVALPAENTLQERKLTSNQEYTLQNLKAVLAEKQTDSVHIEDWRPHFYGGHTADKADTKQKAFNRGRQELVSLGIIHVNEDIYSLNDDRRTKDIGRTL